MGAGIENRITYDPDEITRLLENQLDKLKVFRFDSRYRSLLGESFINLAARWEKDILSRRTPLPWWSAESSRGGNPL